MNERMIEGTNEWNVYKQTNKQTNQQTNKLMKQVRVDPLLRITAGSWPQLMLWRRRQISINER